MDEGGISPDRLSCVVASPTDAAVESKSLSPKPPSQFVVNKNSWREERERDCVFLPTRVSCPKKKVWKGKDIKTGSGVGKRLSV